MMTTVFQYALVRAEELLHRDVESGCCLWWLDIKWQRCTAMNVSKVRTMSGVHKIMLTS